MGRLPGRDVRGGERRRIVSRESPGAGGAGEGGFRHLAFRVSRTGLEEAQAVFRRRGVKFAFEDHGISQSIYLNDPDGYVVELTTYESASTSGA
jgi:catechol-2,3-dioxygenase